MNFQVESSGFPRRWGGEKYCLVITWRYEYHLRLRRRGGGTHTLSRVIISRWAKVAVPATAFFIASTVLLTFVDGSAEAKTECEDIETTLTSVFTGPPSTAGAVKMGCWRGLRNSTDITPLHPQEWLGLPHHQQARCLTRGLWCSRLQREPLLPAALGPGADPGGLRRVA